MNQKACLNRKFILPTAINYKQHLQQLLRIQLVFHFSLLTINCILNMSLKLHLFQIYTSQFWTSQGVANSNLALTITSMLLIPYLVFIEIANFTLIKDLFLTALLLHLLICALVSGLTVSIYYLLYIAILSIICTLIASLLAAMREQRNLINQLYTIKLQDSKEQHISLSESQSAKLTGKNQI